MCLVEDGVNVKPTAAPHDQATANRAVLGSSVKLILFKLINNLIFFLLSFEMGKFHRFLEFVT